MRLFHKGVGLCSTLVGIAVELQCGGVRLVYCHCDIGCGCTLAQADCSPLIVKCQSLISGWALRRVYARLAATKSLSISDGVVPLLGSE